MPPGTERRSEANASSCSPLSVGFMWCALLLFLGCFIGAAGKDHDNLLQAVHEHTPNVTDVVEALIANYDISVCFMWSLSDSSCSMRNALIKQRFDEHKKSLPVLVSDAVQHRPFNPLYVHKSTKKGASRSCTDLSDYKYVIDFTCSHRWYKAYFHFQFDCLIGNFDLITAAVEMDGPDTLILLPDIPRIPVQEWLRIASPDNWFQKGNHLSRLRTIRRGQCIFLAQDSTVFYAPTRYLWVDFMFYKDISLKDKRVERMLSVGSRFTQRIKDYTSKNQLLREPSILWIQRNQTRRIRNSGSIVKKLRQKFPHLRLVKYHGDESADVVVQKFYSADIVVGFHGAGFVNTMFCREGTLIVEYTVHMDISDSWNSLRNNNTW